MDSTSCQMHPFEYAYQKDSVRSDETHSANCRMYPEGLHIGSRTENYIHCNGTQLKLADSDFGQLYRNSDYYQWSAGSTTQHLLFIFPTKVNLTTITLHYYSDSDRGLPRLRFFAVPDDFDIWEIPTVTNRLTEVNAVPPQEPAGHRNISIDFNFYTDRVLMFKTRSTFQFAASEVQFFTCTGK